MNSPQNPDDPREARLTALLLGELSAEEASAIRQAIQEDPEWAQLHERLKRTIELVGEAAATPPAQTTTQPTLLKLSEARRNHLLEHFKTVAPRESIHLEARETPWFIPMSLAAALVALIGSVALLPGYWKQLESRAALARGGSFENGRATDTALKRISRAPLRDSDQNDFQQQSVEGLEERHRGQVTTLSAAGIPAQNANVRAFTVNNDLGALQPGGNEAGAALRGISQPASGGRPAKPAPNNIVLPPTGDSASALEGSSIQGVPTASGPATSLAFGGDFGGGRGGGLGGGGGIGGGGGGFTFPRADTTGGTAGFGRGGAGLGGTSTVAELGYPTAESEQLAAQPGAETPGFVGRYAYTLPPPPAVDQLGTARRWREQAVDSKTSPATGVVAGDRVSGVNAGTSTITLGDQPSLGQYFRATDGIAQQDKRNAATAFLPPAPSTAPAQPPASKPGGLPGGEADGKIGVRAGTAPSRPDSLTLGTATLNVPAPRVPPVTLQVPEAPTRPATELFSVNGSAARSGGSVVTATKSELAEQAGKNLELGLENRSDEASRSLARGSQVSPAQNQPLPQAGQTQSERWYFDEAAPRQERLSQKQTENFSGSDKSKGAQTTDGDADVGQAALPAPGQQSSPTPQMDPQLMARYGLLRPGGPESKSKESKTSLPDETLRRSARQPMAPPTASPTGGAEGVIEAYPESQRLAAVADKERAKQVVSEETKMAGIEKKLSLGTQASVPEQTRALEEKTRELGNLVQLRENLSQRVLAEKVDAALPSKGSVVQIVDRAQAEPEKKPKLLEQLRGRVTGQVERAARIEVGKDTTDIAPLLLGARNQAAYDPYFISTEAEKIRSKAVLRKVIEKLSLNETWAREHGAGEKLKTEETLKILSDRIDVRSALNSSQIEIRAKGEEPEEAARIANTIAEVYRDLREEKLKQASAARTGLLNQKLAEQEKNVARAREELERLTKETNRPQADISPPKPAAPAPVPQPEVQTRDNAFSTFSLNISDVSFRLAAASLEKGVMPEPATVRSEEFINAFDYRDSEPPPGLPIAFAWERARYPFAQNRDLLRFSVKTAAVGRQPGRPLNLVLLLDNSGSMERADRVRTLHEALRVLAAQLQPQDKLSVIAFARTARLWVDGLPGPQAGQIVEQLSRLTPQGGTNLEDALDLAYQTALRHYAHGGVNRVVLLTDGAANLGAVEPGTLKQKVEANRKQGIALDCFGVGWDGFNDDLLEVLSRNGDGRYGFINTPEEAATEFVGQLAGALRVAASDVKVQVEFDPRRVSAYRQIGYAKHQLTKEQFRDNTVDAAEIGAAESGNALYLVEVNPRGEGPLGMVRVRYKVPGTVEYHEREWPVLFTGQAMPLEQASPALRLAATSSAFSEWLVSSPYAGEVTPDRLLAYLSGVPEVYGADARPKKLEWMIRQAKSITGR